MKMSESGFLREAGPFLYKPPVYCVNCVHRKQAWGTPSDSDRCTAGVTEKPIISPVTGKGSEPVLQYCTIVNKNLDCAMFERKIVKKSWWKFW